MSTSPVSRTLTARLRGAAKRYPVVTLAGPRQSGKTTLVRATFPAKTWVSLEDPDVRTFAHDDPRGFLARYADGAIFDEVQRAPIRDVSSSPGRGTSRFRPTSAKRSQAAPLS